MGKRQVIVTFPMRDPDVIRQVNETLTDFELSYISLKLPLDNLELLRLYCSGDRAALLDLAKQFPKEFLDRLPEVEVLYGLYFPVDLLQRAPKLKWIANMGSGTEQYAALGILGSHVTLTSSKGVAARSIAEFTLGQLLMMSKRFADRLRYQQAHQWKRIQHLDLYGKTLGVVGLGEIGSEVARMAKAFGMRILATRRREGGEPPPNVDAMYPVKDLRAMLAQCDAVVLTLASTPESRGLIGAEEFAIMKKGVLLANVARGDVLDEDALIQEPLQQSSPLWDLPNVIMSTHNSIGMDDYPGAAFAAFVANLQRYGRGEPLQQVVDPAKGY
jgi:phosphoglycerate dehydrogenase-like enzyme